MKLPLETAEYFAQWRHLLTPRGVAQGGRMRYAAAMHFYNRAMIDAATLESFRVVAKADGVWPDVLCVVNEA